MSTDSVEGVPAINNKYPGYDCSYRGCSDPGDDPDGSSARNMVNIVSSSVSVLCVHSSLFSLTCVVVSACVSRGD
jgi:hypothetical protein